MNFDDVLASLEPALSTISARARTIESAKKSLAAARTALKKKSAVDLAEAAAQLKKLDGGALGIEGWIDLVGQLDTAAREAVREAAFLFTRDLREAFSAASVPLTGGPGRFVSDPFVIEVDERKGLVWILYGKEPVIPKPLPLSAGKVLKAREAAAKDLARGRTNEAEFLAKLFDAYKRVLREQQADVGERANVLSCFREMVFLRQSPAFRNNPVKATFSEYPKWRFAYDLAEVRKSGKHSHVGYRLQLAPATIHESGDKSRVLWLPSSGDEGAYIADIWWRSESHGS